MARDAEEEVASLYSHQQHQKQQQQWWHPQEWRPLSLQPQQQSVITFLSIFIFIFVLSIFQEEEGRTEEELDGQGLFVPAGQA